SASASLARTRTRAGRAGTESSWGERASADIRVASGPGDRTQRREAAPTDMARSLRPRLGATKLARRGSMSLLRPKPIAGSAYVWRIVRRNPDPRLAGAPYRAPCRGRAGAHRPRRP